MFLKKVINFILKLLFNLLLVLFFCEFLIYYLVIVQCNYKKINEESIDDGLKAIIVADTHLLGPFRGHPFDKLRREWQMKRSFQTAVQLFEPDIVFFLGDVFDEGNWVNDKGFQDYVDRFQSIFNVPSTTRIYAIMGNHDVNFHYNMHPHLVKRFNVAFNTSGIGLIREEKVTTKNTPRYVNFITINSMAMEGDSCNFCLEARESLKFYNVRLNTLKGLKSYSRPFVLQHFPTFRESDEKCEEKNSENNAKYREKWETLSKEASDYIENLLQPRGYFSGHTHHYCKYKKENNYEFTLASFNWRNIDNPSFLLAVFTPDDFSVEKCDLPKESTVIACYVLGTFLSLILAIIKFKTPFSDKTKTS